MKKIKNQEQKNEKGITLVALVVTIVVLIILAGITLSLVLGQNGIVNKAKEARDKTQADQLNTEIAMNSLYNEMEETISENGGVTDLNKVSTVKDAKEKSATPIADNKALTDDNSNIVTVPAGFKIANDSATVATGGVVITDGTNEFVWVSVADASKMYQTIASTNLTGTTVPTTISSASEILTGKTRGITGSTSYREPDLLASYDTDSQYYNTILGYSNTTAMANAFVADYKAMIDSVNTYKGFYIGRYELTGTVEAPTEKAGTTLANQNWYNLYKACKNVVTGNSHAVSSMIWGCQWDETISWLISSGAKTDAQVNTDSSSWGNYNTSSVIATGSNNTYKANNIYDLAGNCFEWTQEAFSTDVRASRGGSFTDSGSGDPASIRSFNNSYNINSTYSSRPILYIK